MNLLDVYSTSYSRRQKAEGRSQEAEGRKQKAEVKPSFSRSFVLN
jgi:hypothetical protein